MEKINITINNMPIEVEKGLTVLEAAKLAGIHIPTLCHLKDVNNSSSCRVCLVDTGTKLVTSCTLVAEEGMAIQTNTPKVRNARKTVVELILSNHKMECPVCSRNDNCELQAVARDLNIKEVRYQGAKLQAPIDQSSPSIIRDTEKCILCGRCVNTCSEIQTVHAIDFINRGFDTVIAPAYGKMLDESMCINCGQCILACPVGALREKDNTDDVWHELANPNKFVVVQTAPATRVALGEEFGLPIGTNVKGKMVAALRKIGFDKVFDTDFAADLTIMEEGTELIKRLEQGENLPLMTSCCPGWIKFMEHQYPEMLNHLSTCKSPHEMEGALIKSYFAKQMDIDPEKIVVVSIMPCTAKKFESVREELSKEHLQDVDYVLTTRELAQMIKEAGVNFISLEDESFDNPFGEGTGASVIFGATGGVTEAALRTVYELVSGKELADVSFQDVRGLEGVKEATIELPNGPTINTAVIHGLGNARKVLEEIKSGKKDYQFIEVMACPGGCINGGGQPIVKADIRDKIDIKVERSKALYQDDQSLAIRKSHENPEIKKIYEDFLLYPNSHISHELLHTHYMERSRV